MADDTSLTSPVRSVPGDTNRPPQDGIALCLSGGGYRAMLFHLGALVRLNELAYLAKLARISSVSGGSITAGVLGLKWNRLAFDGSGVAQRLHEEVIDPIRAMAGTTIDVRDIVLAFLTPGTVAEKVAASYQQHLFGPATLQDLPDSPRFVINATSVQSGVLWRFSKPFMADWRVGMVKNPKVLLATAVGASSAFPPVLSPVRLDLKPFTFEPGSGTDLQTAPYTSEAVLTDGGVYDNLGLETAFKNYKTVLVSDGGGHMAAMPDPHSDWPRHALRVNDLIDNQVRDLRKRQLIGAFANGDRAGTYWSVRSNLPKNYPAPGVLPCPFAATEHLAAVPTRLAALEDEVQEQLINWGYAICDAAMRLYVDTNAPAPVAFPYPSVGVGTGV
jgi:NTE family protein